MINHGRRGRAGGVGRSHFVRRAQARAVPCRVAGQGVGSDITYSQGAWSEGEGEGGGRLDGTGVLSEQSVK